MMMTSMIYNMTDGAGSAPSIILIDLIKMMKSCFAAVKCDGRFKQ